jgi:hypothetical protein
MKLRVIAFTVAVALLGGGFLTASAASGHQTAKTDNFHLRSTEQCTLAGTPTTCTVDVVKLKRVGDQVMAIGTVTAANGPTVKFRAPVMGANSSTGPIGQSALVGQQATAGSCDILNLVLGPLHLNLLGLVVDLNQVVLNITGQTGAGNLLGNLLCGLFGLLDGTAVLQQFIGALQNLLAAINQILAL